MPSYPRYDYFITREVIEYYLDNTFMCKFIIENETYSLDTIIYKPCPKEKLMTFLDKIKEF